MKRIILLLIFLACFTPSSIAQLSTDFPDSNYYWNERHDYMDVDFPNLNRSYDGTIYHSENVIIQNKKLQKINYKYVGTYYVYENNTLVTKNYNRDELLGYIHNDRINKKVYFKPNNTNFFSHDTSMNLLFDFNLNIGDLYPITINNTDSNIIVNKIDSITDPWGNKRAVYYMNVFNAGNNYFLRPVIQGIGFCGGLLNKYFQMPFEGYYGDISCFNFNEVKFKYQYHESDSGKLNTELHSDSCNVVEFIGIDTKKISPIYIIPNPVTNTLLLDITDENVKFIVINSLNQIQHVNVNRENSMWKIDVSSLSNGIYFLEAITSETQYQGKFLKN